MKKVVSIIALCVGFYSMSAQSLEPKTVVIKAPGAENHDVYFSHAEYHFEIYKPGTEEELAKLISSFANDPQVASCTAGKRTGDFQMIDLTLKKPFKKAWFSYAFSRAGIPLVKINNEEPVIPSKL